MLTIESEVLAASFTQLMCGLTRVETCEYWSQRYVYHIPSHSFSHGWSKDSLFLRRVGSGVRGSRYDCHCILLYAVVKAIVDVDNVATADGSVTFSFKGVLA
jgi:hypothetical protein